MAAEVSRQIKGESKPITRDFLGGCSAIESKELDLDLQVPAGWEKRLDLKSGKVYIQRTSQSSISKTHQPIPKTTPLSLFDDTSLDLKLSPSKPISNPNNATYQSVCTLDKVKSALDRAWLKKRPSPSNSASSSMATDDSNSNVWSSRDCSGGSAKMVAGACPACLLYVLISEINPRCPKCNCVIALRDGSKKAKFDLNMSL